MSLRRPNSPLWHWIFGDLRRRPGAALLSGLGLTALTLVVTAALLVVESTALVYEQAIAAGPSVLVRRVEGDRWAPFPDAAAEDAARGVRGVLRAEARPAPGRAPAPGQADELAVDVFHETEEAAVLPDLTAALGWPARAITRTEARGIAESQLARRANLSLFVLAPALLALLYLVVAGAREQRARRRETGLLRAVGWSTTDLARVFAGRALLLGIPAAAVGFAGALGLVFGGASPLVARLVLAAESVPPLPFPGTGRALMVGAVVGAVVLIPWACATIWPLFRLAAADPGELIDEGRR